MHNNTIQSLSVDLQLFAGSEAAPAAGSAEIHGRAGSSHRPASGAERPAAGETLSGAKTDPPAAGEGAGKSDGGTPEDKRKAFRSLIEGEYREQYAELFQSAFNRRFREAKGMESRLAAQQPVLELLAQRYNVPAGDMEQLRAALEQDDGYWQQAAKQAGMSVEQYRQFIRYREDSRRLQQLQNRRKAGEQLRGWLREAGELRGRYPGFDFRAELADDNFRSLLRSGVSVRQAYELRHMEELKAAAAREAARSAGAQMAARIRSKDDRPRENGISGKSAVVTGSGVRDLTPAQRREIARRVQRGDKIRF